MQSFLLSGAYAVLLWWFGTGIILFLNRLPARTFSRSLLAASLLLLVAIAGLLWSRTDDSVAGAYIAFTSGFLIYAWLELTYYMGYITGPRKIRCKENCAGWVHFGHAVQTNLYHEAATILFGILAMVLCKDQPNQTGMWTFLLLWGMQLSAKLNVYLGVRNLSEEFVPVHLQHLKSFLRQRPMNMLFPLSITVGTLLAGWLVLQTLEAGKDTHEATAYMFLTSLALLAVLEHWLLVLPISTTVAWQWWLDATQVVEKRSSAGIDDTQRAEIHSFP